MKSTTHFPLLRSSPAVGTGSYGALPSLGAGEGSSYAPSSLSASTVSGEDDGKDSDGDDENGPRLRKRPKRGGLVGGLADRSKDGEVEGFTGADGTVGVESEDDGVEDEDEEDPVDNSP